MNYASVFIVILQYNNSQDTLRCLESLKELDYPNFEVVVVDNASDKAEVNNIRKYIFSQGEDENLKDIISLVRSSAPAADSLAVRPGCGRSLEEALYSSRPSQPRAHSDPETISSKFSKTKINIVVNKENLGYAGGNNIGIKYALKNGADYVFILNNDTTVEPETLTKLIEAAESDKSVGIVGPAIKEGEKTAYFGKIAWFKTELTHSHSYPRVNLGRGYLRTREYVIGAAMLIKREVLEKIEGFDEIYFLYFEDADLNIRAQAAGYKLKIVPEAVVHHQVSASTKKLGSPLILRYHMRNALIFNSLNAPWTVKIFLIFWAGYIVLKNILKIFLMPDKAPAADAIMEGVLDFYKNKFGKINA